MSNWGTEIKIILWVEDEPSASAMNAAVDAAQRVLTARGYEVEATSMRAFPMAQKPFEDRFPSTKAD